MKEAFGKRDQVLFAERVPDRGQVQDKWRDVTEINTERAFFFGPLSGTFVRIYNINLRDQEFFAQFVSIDILGALRLHAVPR